ncbi:hypothetical protein ACW9HR_22300 [Nocardia gipuzkoensis]
MINILCQDPGTIVVTIHHDDGAASEIRIHDMPDDLEIVTDIAQSVSARVTIDGAQTLLDADR